MTKRERIEEISEKLSQMSSEIDEFIKEFWNMPEPAFEVLDKASMQLEHASNSVAGIKNYLISDVYGLEDYIQRRKNELLRRS